MPSYSPELNPDEYLNCDLKAGVHSGVPVRTKDQLGKKAISHLRMLQKKKLGTGKICLTKFIPTYKYSDN